MRERLLRLEATVRELDRFRRSYSDEDMRRDPHLEWALRYGLLEAIQIIIDVSCHLVSENNLGTPATYAECIELLRRAGLLDDTLAQAVTQMVGLRNMLVHEYASVDAGRLYALLGRLDDFRSFVARISPHIK